MRFRWLIFAPLPFLVWFTFHSGDFAKWYFESFDMPSLSSKNSGYVSAMSFSPTSPNVDRSQFKFASKSQTGDIVTERYVSEEGNVTTLSYKGGKWISSRSECKARVRQGYFSFVGFALFGIGALLRAFRTRQWFYFPGMQQAAYNYNELTLVVYGMAIFMTSIFTPSAPCVMPYPK